MKINVVDAGCGVGKTTALINLINNDTSNQKYIFITPFLSEVEKILKYSEPSDLYYINKYIPDDFEWTEENFINLAEQIKNQT
jgi:hypothetical protein